MFSQALFLNLEFHESQNNSYHLYWIIYKIIGGLLFLEVYNK